MNVTNASLTSGKIHVDLYRCVVKVDGNEVVLTMTEYRILVLLISSNEKVLSRDEILDAIWGKSVHVYPRNVDTAICKIRKKLGSAASRLESRHGMGYQLRSS